MPESSSEKAGAIRLKNLVEQVQHSSVAAMQPARRFWFARLSELTPGNILREPIWMVRPQEPPTTLLEEFEANQHIRHPQAD